MLPKNKIVANFDLIIKNFWQITPKVLAKFWPEKKILANADFAPKFLKYDFGKVLITFGLEAVRARALHSDRYVTFL